MSQPLPSLLDRKQLQRETGLTRAGVDAVFRSVPIVCLPGLRKPMVRRADVEALITSCTYRDGETVR